MSFNNISLTEELYNIGIVPVVKIENPDDAVPLARALQKGGLACAEITFRSDAAEESIRRISKEVPELLVGAGTVLNEENAKRAIDAGAKFIVSPGFNPKTVKYVLDRGVSMFPGCNNPSAVEGAIELGLKDLKFFPAEQSGGLPMIKALCAPYINVRFMPTGGVNEKNINEYLSFPKIIACGGTWMVKEELIRAKRFDEIEKMTGNAVNTMLGFKLKHIGINCNNEGEALGFAETLQNIFNVKLDEGLTSIFAGREIELTKTPFLGENGHIAIGVNSVDRAYYHLSKRNIKFRKDTLSYDEEGKLKTVYLEDEIGGFAVHLCKND